MDQATTPACSDQTPTPPELDLSCFWRLLAPLNFTDDDPFGVYQSSNKSRSFKSDDYLWIYLSPIIFVLGICGNSLTLLVMRRKHLRGTTTSIYMPALAIADTIALTSGIVPEWMEAVHLPLFNQLSPEACRFEKLIFYSSSDTAIWLLVIFTFDRFIAVCFPLKKRLICVTARSKLAVVAALLLAVVKNVHVIWTRGATYDEYGYLISNCDRPEPYVYFERFVRPWLAFAMVSALPFIILSFCNSMIVHQMITMKRVRLDRTGNKKAFAQTTTMCLSASFAFLILITPSMVMHIGKPYWSTSNNSHYDIAKTISNLLSYLSHSINFFLYCVTGAKFRRELLLIFLPWRAGIRSGLEELSTAHTLLGNGRRLSSGQCRPSSRFVTSQISETRDVTSLSVETSRLITSQRNAKSQAGNDLRRTMMLQKTDTLNVTSEVGKNSRLTMMSQLSETADMTSLQADIAPLITSRQAESRNTKSQRAKDLQSQETDLGKTTTQQPDWRNMTSEQDDLRNMTPLQVPSRLVPSPHRDVRSALDSVTEHVIGHVTSLQLKDYKQTDL